MLSWFCCDCDTTITQTVRGCASALLSGLTVNVKIGGVTVGTGTTNGSGVVSITVSEPTGTSATVEIVAPTGYATNTGTVTLACSTITRSTTLSLASGYSCSANACCPQGGSAPYPILTFPSTITLNDGFGDITLSQVGGSTSTQYRGSATRTAAQGYACATDPTGSPWPLNASQSVTVYFDLQCATLTVSCNDCVNSSGGAGCDQAPTLNFLHGAGLSLTAYPSTLTDNTSSCYHAYGVNGTSGGEFFSSIGVGSISACPSAYAGSATVYFKATSGAATWKYAGWQVYGDSAAFTWVQ